MDKTPDETALPLRREVIGDPRFFASCGPFSLSIIAAAAGAEPPERHLVLEGVAPLHCAEPNHLSFLENRRYAAALQNTHAGAVIVHPEMVPHVPAGTIAIATKNPYSAWAKAAALFYPARKVRASIHPTAYVATGAIVHATVEIGPFCSIEAGATIGKGTWLGSHVSVGQGVVIGNDCRIGDQVSLSHALVGNRVYLYAGARIGQEGFGFAPTPAGFLSVPQLGRVIVEDDVEVGANTTIDRGSLRDTVIGAGSRIDNLVQISHNVNLGRCCVVVAQVGIAGSTTVEDFVQIGGQAAIAGHLRIGKGARIGAQSGVISDLPPNAVVLGSPAQPRTAFFRQIALQRRIGRKASETPTKPGR